MPPGSRAPHAKKSDEPPIGFDPEFDTFNEANIKELIGEASSELQRLLKAAALSIKQVHREMTRMQADSADLFHLISSELLES